MYIDRIREVFEKNNFKANSQINQQNFYQLLSQLTVYLHSLSQAKPMTKMWQTNSGNKLQEEPLTLKSTTSAKPSTTVSVYSKSNWTKSIVHHLIFRGNQAFGQRENASV